MSAWHHCNKPEPHEYHEWQETEITADDLPWCSLYSCPGVKVSSELATWLRVRDDLQRQTDEANRLIVEISTARNRRAISQFELADDLAFPVPECGHTAADGGCTRCVWEHAVCPKEWRA